MRTITNHIEQELTSNRLEYSKALGYMSTWCNNSYPFVDIYPDKSCGENSFVACYRNEPHGDCLYCMGAVWDKDTDTYSFHS